MKTFSWTFYLFGVIQILELRGENIKNDSEGYGDKNFHKPEDACDPSDLRWYTLENDPHKFLYCDASKSQFAVEKCAVINGVKKVFDERYQQCLMPAARVMRQSAVAGSGRVGDMCQYNTDCLTGMYCSSGQCICLSNYISRDHYCYQKYNPTESGCTFEEQCNAVWPMATCSRVGGASTGTCQCPTGLTAAQTPDGYVCLSPNSCPTPEGKAQETALTATGATDPVACTIGSTCPTNLGPTVPELYDCLPKVGAADGICCASRAYACTMPRATTSAPGTNPETRWYYNSVTHTCEQFIWYSQATTGHNANNFKTKAHCETYCRDTCERGRPKYTGGTSNQRTPISCTGTRTGCDSKHACDTVGSFRRCCPTAEYICSGNGGTGTLSSDSNAGFAAAKGGYAAGMRWYYSTTTTACMTFNYQGAGGNFNNFGSQADCQNFCNQVLCSQGSPIKDANGNYQTCSSNANCPVTHQCESSVCCPRAQTVCAQPQIIGTCGQFVRRYWYNAATRDCELFTYSGCQGNDNNFETLLECQNFCRNTNPEPQCIQGSAYRDMNGNFYKCSNIATTSNVCPANYECYYDGFLYGCCPTKAYTCSLTYQQGVPCGVRSARWYYDTTTQSCQTFEYLGCDGNSNNFASRSLCENYCGVGGCPYGGTPYKEPTGQTRVCSAAVTCPSGFDCFLVTLGTSSQVNYCCPTKARICGLPPNTGGAACNSQATVTRYYFNVATKKCTTFNYNGCEGNANNFATLAQCNNFCMSAACEAGEIVYKNPNSLTTTTCNQALKSSCPTGYTCRYDSLTGNNVCCGGTDAGVCPRGERAFLDVTSQAARECRPNVVGGCPANYLCRFNPKNSRYYCCSTSTGRLCPAGKALYFSPSTNRHTVCTLNNVVNTCPAGYSCQSAVSGSFQGYCCTVNPICPSGGDFYAETSGTNRNNPRVCTVGQTGVFNTCPANYTCQASGPGSSTGYCCTGTATSVCGSLLAYEVGGQPVTCQPGLLGSQSTCPFGYKCQLNTVTNKYYCCQESGGVCGSRKPYFLNNYPLTCKPGVKQCPESYTCEQFGSSGTYYCCAGGPSDGCPGNTQISATNPICAPNQPNNCPAGYTCQFSTINSRYQCCGQSAPSDGCPAGQIGYKPPGSMGVQACTLGAFNRCPTGYSCQYAGQVQRYQCCGVSGGCPSQGVAFITVAGQPQACSLGRINACPQGFTCRRTRTGTSVCCTGTQVMGQCPGTTRPYINPGTNQVQSCVPGQASACLPGYVCTRSQGVQTAGTTQSYLCCSVFNPTVAPPVAQPRCPIPGQRVLMLANTARARMCTPGRPNACPAGYTCQYSSTTSSFVCCGGVTSRTCTGVCVPNAYRTGCAPGYSCQYNPTSRSFQCCTGSGTGTVRGSN